MSFWRLVYLFLLSYRKRNCRLPSGNSLLNTVSRCLSGFILFCFSALLFFCPFLACTPMVVSAWSPAGVVPVPTAQNPAPVIGQET